MSKNKNNNIRHGHGRMMVGERAKNFKKSIKQLFKYLGKYKIAIFLVVIFSSLSTLFNILGPKILGDATTVLFEGVLKKISLTGNIDYSKIASILIKLMSIYVISAIFQFLQGWIMSGISQKISFNLRNDVIKKINKMPLSYFEKNKTGDVLSRITNDVDTLSQSLNQSIIQLITSSLTVIGILIVMLSMSVRMTLITILILPISAILVILIVSKSQKYFKSQQENLGNLNGQIEETFSGHSIIKAFNREKKELSTFNETNEKLYNSGWKSQFLSGLMMPVMNFVSNIGYVLVAISGAMFAASGLISIGDIVAFIQYVSRFTQPIMQLAQVSNMIQSMAAASERIFEFLDEKEEIENIESYRISSEKIEGNVNFENVSFGYLEGKNVINNFSTRIEAGKMVAIVGPTGAGKTTIVKLLMRFYDVNNGSIKIDGHNIKNFKRQDLRKNFSMVLQDTWLFKDSIMENIRYGRLEASDEEVIEAAKSAFADHFIRTLPGGYSMEINEEASNISQGQKQLITIARAILADRPILILDEATSSVDTRTESAIQKAMSNLMKGRTSFVIAHRLSTIKDADTILVMNDGDIVEQGNHEELIEKDGFYAKLYNSQFEQKA